MIGQQNLQRKIKNLSLDNFPHSILLVGETGCGKHTLFRLLAEHLILETEDITQSISQDKIYEMTLDVSPKLYLVDCTNITLKQENILLKILEEPTKNVFLVLICETLSQVLPTIRNRCQTWEFEPYSVDDLKLFTQDETLCYVATTPGQILNLQENNITELFNLCNTILDRIANANYSNTLTIDKKVDVKRDGNGYDFSCFVRCLLHIITDRLRNDAYAGRYKKLIEAYRLTSTLNQHRYIPHVNLQYLLDCYLTNLKQVML